MPAEWDLPLLVGERYEFVEPTDEGIEFIAENLRPHDADEVHAQTGTRRFTGVLRVCVAASSSARMAVSAYGTPMAILGVTTTSLIYNTGSPWMLGTPEVEQHRRALIDCGRTYTAAMLMQYERLENHVDARNKRSVAWLQRLGFKLEPAAPHGPLGLPFHRFWIER